MCDSGRGRIWSFAFQIVHIFIRSGDISDRSLKLSKIVSNFGQFFPSQILGGGWSAKQLYPNYHACLAARQVKKTINFFGPMTLKFNRVLEVFEISAKYHQAECSGSWVIVPVSFLPFLPKVKKNPKIQSCDLHHWLMTSKFSGF